MNGKIMGHGEIRFKTGEIMRNHVGKTEGGFDASVNEAGKKVEYSLVRERIEQQLEQLEHLLTEIDALEGQKMRIYESFKEKHQEFRSEDHKVDTVALSEAIIQIQNTTAEIEQRYQKLHGVLEEIHQLNELELKLEAVGMDSDLFDSEQKDTTPPFAINGIQQDIRRVVDGEPLSSQKNYS